ncbi:MAG: ERV1/ALR-related protein [Nitrosomonas sp.]|nr:ERV1/ALR-related protein [Nitrosomonas sp.]
MAFNPIQDGPTLWRTIHLMAANATTARKRELYVNWLNSLKEVFPCEKCRLHLIKNLEEPTADGSVGPGPVEPYSKSNVSLFRHSWKLHDTVNQQLNKPMEQRLTFEQAFEIYFKTKVPTAVTNAEKVEQKAVVAPAAINVPVQKARVTRVTPVKKSMPVRNAVKTQERFMAAAGNKMPSFALTTPLQEPVQPEIQQQSPIVEQVYVDEPIEMPPSLQCTSCGMPEHEAEPAAVASVVATTIAEEPKTDFDTYRTKARRTFITKN